jgi:hypothetical protein
VPWVVGVHAWIRPDAPTHQGRGNNIWLILGLISPKQLFFSRIVSGTCQ